MSCNWSHTDCQNENSRCDLCLSRDFHYSPKTVKKKPGLAKRQAKQDKRQGSSFEFKNHQHNAALLKDATSGMTPNSGAGSIKGDEQITGIIRVMEELKTKTSQQAPGKETFTIKKEWLQKLNREAHQSGFPFYYLKFSFQEFDPDIYVITEQDIIMNFVKTIVHDRKAVKRIELEKDVAVKEMAKYHADLIAAQAEIELLKAKLALIKLTPP